MYTLTSATSRLLTTTGLQYNMDSDNLKHLILKVNTMPNKINFMLPAHNLVSSETNYPLQTPNITLELPTYVTY